MTAKTSPRHQIKPPALPAAPPVLTGSEAGMRLYALASAEEEVSGLLIRNADLSGEELQRLSLHRCVLEGCRFQGADLTKVSFTDCALKNCDLSGAKLWEGYFSRCELQGCKALGTNFAESRLFDVTIQDCQLRYACFERSKWDRVQISGSSLAEGMLTEAVLKRVRFTQTELTRVNFQRTPLKGLDLRGCPLAGAGFSEDNRELRGAVVDSLQAVELARLLGVVIKD